MCCLIAYSLSMLLVGGDHFGTCFLASDAYSFPCGPFKSFVCWATIKLKLPLVIMKSCWFLDMLS